MRFVVTLRIVNVLNSILYTQDCEDPKHHIAGENCHVCDIRESLALADGQSLYGGCNGSCMSVGKPLLHDITNGKP